jgi:hypothetical protein
MTTTSILRPLGNYACGAWVTGTGKTTELFNAITGEAFAQASTGGLDTSAMVAYAKTKGGPALRKMTFHERALMLKAAAQYLMARKDEFYLVSAATGATKQDSWIDIEGGIGTLFAYASRGRRDFPNERFYVDGPTEPLSKGGTFVGRHICVPLEGVAVHINAFNFPVWGMLEKLAPTLLAGMPAIVKPATVTSYLTEAVFRGRVHRIGADGQDAEGISVDHRQRGSLQHGSGFAELLDAWPRRSAGHAGIRFVRQGSRSRDDDEGRSEVHRYPAHVRSRQHGPRCDGGVEQTSLDGHDR